VLNRFILTCKIRMMVTLRRVVSKKRVVIQRLTQPMSSSSRLAINHLGQTLMLSLREGVVLIHSKILSNRRMKRRKGKAKRLVSVSSN